MNEKITLPALVSFLADKSGKPKKQCEDFLREFFGVVAETLCDGESVKAKGLGTFKIITVEARKSVNVNTGEEMEIPSHRKLVFSPSKELAEAVNSPFSMFETVEIPGDADTDFREDSENVDGDMICNDATETFTESNPPKQPAPEIIQQQLPEEDETPKVTEETDTDTETETYIAAGANENHDNSNEAGACREQNILDEAESETSGPKTDSARMIESSDCFMDTDIIPETQKKNTRRLGFLTGFVCGILSATLACAGIWFLCLRDDTSKKKETINAEKVIVSEIPKPEETALANSEIKVTSAIPAERETQDTVTEGKTADNVKEANDAVPTQPSDKIYDTISKTRYLTTMAKEYYGNYNLWPYIYEENKAILGHPDRIKPGTRVVVPPLSKYGVNPNNPDDIRRAKQKGVEIYSRYK